jgi:arylsulfatase A-like enzyme
LRVAELSVISHRLVMHIIFSMRVLSLEREAGPGIVKTTLDGVNQIDYLTGKSEKSARDTFFYYSSAHPSAVRYKNWKMYFAIAPETPTGFISPGVHVPYFWNA